MSTKEQYIVSARKYRPATFDTVVGQKALTSTLKNAILGGKLAQAYLFCGPRGVGKTSCARIFAKTINCLHPTPDGEACGECESCKAIEKGNSFNLVELDAASNNSVDNIREITDQVNVPAQDGRYRVFIIDEVHMLSNSAFNAFLKTLEEPPKNVVFILATTERHKVIPTILSRCQVYDFRRITINDIIDHLEYVANNEGVSAEREALGVIALKADGAMRDALSIFDQVVASTHGNVTYKGTIEALNVLDQDYYFKLVDLFRSGDVAGGLLTFKEITDKGFDPQFFINGLAEHVRNLMVCADPRTVSLLETSEEWARKYNEQAPTLPAEWYYNAMKILNDADYNYRLSGNKRLLVELTLIRLSRLMNVGENQAAIRELPASPQQPPFVAPVGHKPQAEPAKSPEATTQHSYKQSLKTDPEEGPSQPETNQIRENKPSSQSTKSRVQKPTSFRLTDVASTIAKDMQEGKRSDPFTHDSFMEAWEKYCETHQEQRILIGAMRSSQPVKESETEYRFEVSHPAQKQAFEIALVDLLSYLRKSLSNDYLNLKISISENLPEDKKLPAKEFLKIAIEENPELARFLKDIDAELA